MSTSAAKPSIQTTTQNGPVSKETLLDYLQIAAKSMRRTELGLGIVGWLTVMLLILVIAVFWDHWFSPMNVLLRSTFFVVLIGWAIWWLPRKVFPLLVRPIHPEHAARKIESLYPDLKESLISWLQLATRDEPTPRGVLAIIGRFAARNLRGADSKTVLDNGNLLKLTAFFIACLLSFLIYSFAAPKSTWISLSRIFMPWASIAPASRVLITEVIPGDTTVTQGTNLLVNVSTRGMYQQDAVFLRYDLSDGQKVAQRVPMKMDIQGLSYSLLFGDSFGGIHQPLSYWIEAGDAVAGPFQLRIQSVPIVAIDRLELKYPKYTELKDRIVSKDGSFEAPEGTRIRLFAHCNQPMEKSRVEFNPIIERGVLAAASSMLDLSTSGTELQGEWIALLDDKKSNPTNHRYRIKATNTLGEQNNDPVIYQAKVLADLPPVIKFQSDLPTSLQLPLDKSLDIEVRASDPDYGLSSVSVRIRQLIGETSGKLIAEQSLFESSETSNRLVSKNIRLSATEYQLREGMVLELVAVAKDNRRAPGTENPEPNITLSTPIQVRIVPPSNTKQEADPTSIPNPAKTPEAQKKPNPPKIPETPKESPTKKSGANSSDQNASANKSGEKKESGNSSGTGESANGSEANAGKKDSNQKGNGKSGESQPSDGNSDSDGTGNPSDSKGDTSENKNSKSPDPSSGSSGGTENGGVDNNPRKPADSSNDNKPTNDNPRSRDGKGSENPSPETSNANSQDVEGTYESQNSNRSSSDPSNRGNSSKKPEHPGEIFDAINEHREQTKGDSSSMNQGERENQTTEDARQSQSDADRRQGASDNQQTSKKSDNSSSNPQPSSDSSKADSLNKPANNSGSQTEPKNQSQQSKSTVEQTNDKQNSTGNVDPANSKTNPPSSSRDQKSPGSDSGPEKNSNEGTQGQDDKPSSKRANTELSQDGNQGSRKSPPSNPTAASQPEANSSDPSKDPVNRQEKSGEKDRSTEPVGNKSDSTQKSPKDGAGDSKSGRDSAKDNSSSTDKSSQASNSSEDQKNGKESGKSGEQAGNNASGQQKPSSESSSNDTGSKSASAKTPDKSADATQPDPPGKDSEKDSLSENQGDKNQGDKGQQKNQNDRSQDRPSNSQSDSNSSSSSAGGMGKSEADNKNPLAGKGSDISPPNAGGGKPNQNSDRTNAATSGSNAANEVIASKNKAPDLDYADEMTDLALDYLKDQRDQPDPELLRKLQWSKDDLQRFYDQWRKAKDEAKTDPNKKRDLDATLRSLGLRSSKRSAIKSSDRDDQLKGYIEQGNRVRPPESLRELLDKFNKASSKIE